MNCFASHESLLAGSSFRSGSQAAAGRTRCWSAWAQLLSAQARYHWFLCFSKITFANNISQVSRSNWLVCSCLLGKDLLFVCSFPSVNNWGYYVAKHFCLSCETQSLALLGSAQQCHGHLMQSIKSRKLFCTDFPGEVDDGAQWAFAHLGRYCLTFCRM